QPADPHPHADGGHELDGGGPPAVELLPHPAAHRGVVSVHGAAQVTNFTKSLTNRCHGRAPTARSRVRPRGPYRRGVPTTHLHPAPELVALLHRRVRGPVVPVPVPAPRSVKDAVESVGLPHTEVGAVVVDGVEVDWDVRVVGGERVEVHPVDRVPAGLTGRIRPAPPPRPVRVVADVHLGTLARRLRVLGVDTWW